MPNPRVRVPSSGDTAGARRTSRLRSTGKLLPERDSAGRGLLDLGWTGRRLPAFACLLAHCKLAGGKQVKALQVGLVIKSSMAMDNDTGARPFGTTPPWMTQSEHDTNDA